MEAFPSPYIHIGGDEACKDEWIVSPRMQQRIRELGLADERQLQGHIITQMDAFLASRGRRLIGWDEILESNLTSFATVMSWRAASHSQAAVSRGHDLVVCEKDYTYLDFYQSEDTTRSEPLAIHGCLTLEKAYQFNPLASHIPREHAHHVLGGQAQVWTEYIPDTDHLYYMFYPRAMAIAEALWSQPEGHDFQFFRRRAADHMRILHRLGLHGRPMDI